MNPVKTILVLATASFTSFTSFVAFAAPTGPVTVTQLESSAVSAPESRTGLLTLASYSATKNVTLHIVTYEDGSRDLVRASGEVPRLKVGSPATVHRKQVGTGAVHLSITEGGL